MTARENLEHNRSQPAQRPWEGGEMKPVVVRDLARQFGRVRALDGISFEVETGEIFGLLGPNGAGKTTTIRILTGQLWPSAGRAWVMGWDVVKERQALKPEIGVVFEYQNLYLRMTALENLSFMARLYGVPKSWVEEAIAMVGLQARAGERVKQYSNGMKQRLLIARAMLHRPKVLFLDEPTRGLDPGMARAIRQIVTNLAETGVTIFLTTHYMEEADQLCSRVAFLDQGRIAALGRPVDLKAAFSAAERGTLEDVFIHLTGSAWVK